MFSGFGFPVVAGRLWKHCGHLELLDFLHTFRLVVFFFFVGGTRDFTDVWKSCVQVQTAKQN